MKVSKKKPKKISVPWELYMSLVKLQAEDELDFQGACRRAAMLLDNKNAKYHEEVNKNANSLYKKRHLVELNKAKQTWIENGRKQGYSMTENKFKIEYPCSKCGKPLVLLPGRADTADAIEYLSKKWNHSECS
jgi:hypothetical protein